MAHQPDPKSTDGQESTEVLSRLRDVADDEERAVLDELNGIAAELVEAGLQDRMRTML